MEKLAKQRLDHFTVNFVQRLSQKIIIPNSLLVYFRAISGINARGNAAKLLNLKWFISSEVWLVPTQVGLLPINNMSVINNQVQLTPRNLQRYF